jgi:hypothetical protein
MMVLELQLVTAMSKRVTMQDVLLDFIYLAVAVPVALQTQETARYLVQINLNTQHIQRMED